MEGAGWHHINVKDGKRYSTKEGYLDPVSYRENLTLSQHSQATRLILENGRCVGVEYVKDGERQEARATREVIVCAGAIESPHLLLASGIGATQNLRPYGIDVEVELPGVGENFHNHVLTGVIREGKQQVPTGQAEPLRGRALLQVRPGLAGARPPDGLRPRAVRHHRRAGPPERDQHPARASSARSRAATSGSRAPTRW